eukprot:TRINITY_DN32212_c0_g1_i1.p1 TRINITY_DN32212_c0_g1~~TRINITY_DN32212_c0_g1_i1.p1  ORF type:complete len:214 (-),score=7.90 TRINITY_DN32212_c0_g1_i1:257-898(-)
MFQISGPHCTGRQTSRFLWFRFVPIKPTMSSQDINHLNKIKDALVPMYHRCGKTEVMDSLEDPRPPIQHQCRCQAPENRADLSEVLTLLDDWIAGKPVGGCTLGNGNSLHSSLPVPLRPAPPTPLNNVPVHGRSVSFSAQNQTISFTTNADDTMTDYGDELKGDNLSNSEGENDNYYPWVEELDDNECIREMFRGVQPNFPLMECSSIVEDLD